MWNANSPGFELVSNSCDDNHYTTGTSFNHSELFYAKSFLYIYITDIGFGWVKFYGISTIKVI